MERNPNIKSANELHDPLIVIEELEAREAPGTLIISLNGISDGTSNTIASTSPKFGLTNASLHNNGVTTWIPKT